MRYVAAFAAFCALALPLDRSTDAAQQAVLGASAWAFLVLALRREPRERRTQVLVLVAVATVLEVVGSIVWRAYTYRLDNLPLYVPAGHGLFDLAALRTAAFPPLVRHGRLVVAAVTAGAAAYAAWGLARPPLPDLLGAVTFAVFLRFILRGRYPLLYAVSFGMTTALELYGTALGIWRWAPVLPVLWLPAGNPPTGIGAGYAAMDALSRRITAALRRGAARRSPVAPAMQPELHDGGAAAADRQRA